MKYFGNFYDRDDVGKNFADDPYDKTVTFPQEFPTEEEILFASYGGAAYEGDALVLFEKGGQLFEVHGAHCSCFGLEGQWQPEPTTWDALALRPRTGSWPVLSDHDPEAQERFWALVDSKVGVTQ